MICQICNHEAGGKKFSNHIQREHKVNSKQYTINHLYNEIQPQCENCGNETRYVAYKFKRFCKDCSRIASSVAGKEGGKSQAWNKGKTKQTDKRILNQSMKMSGDGNPFFGKRHSDESIDKMRFTKIVSRFELENRVRNREEEFELLTDYDDYFSRQKQYLEFKCKKCKTVSKKTLQAFERGSLCAICNPVGTSRAEKEIAQFIEDLGEKVELNDRSIISPKEIDILVPNKNLAIEHNGLYYHAVLNDGVKNKRYYLNKKLDAKKKGFNLIHIFSDEWIHKKEICKSMIKNRLGLIDQKIFARKCEIREVEVKEARMFFERNHIAGYVAATIRFGLYYNNELVLCLSLRRPRQGKYKGMTEISRFASKINVNVTGGLTRLIKRSSIWAISEDYKGIVTYADLRFGDGKGYLSASFKFEKDTGPDYWYTDGQVRYDRFRFKSSRGKTEKEIAKENKVFKINGCGSNIFTLMF
tara:strand:- start:3621 stop:5033 length:1413 start_codon:yes stop_codon:yes gene_type:complete